MTVKCLNEHEKVSLRIDWSIGATFDELVDRYSVSRRTVIRVIEEGGFDPGIRRRQRKQDQEAPVQVPNQAELVLTVQQPAPLPAVYRLGYMMGKVFRNIGKALRG